MAPELSLGTPAIAIVRSLRGRADTVSITGFVDGSTAGAGTGAGSRSS